MKTISEIKSEFAAADISEYPSLYQRYEEDSRSGVKKLIEQCHKKEAALEAEKQRTEAMKYYEHKYEHLGFAGLMKWAEDLWQVRWWLLR